MVRLSHGRWLARVARRASCARAIPHRPGTGTRAPGPNTAPPVGAAAPVSQVSAAGRPRFDFGYNDNAVGGQELTAPQDAQLAAEAGANVERVTFDWRWAEQAPGQYELGTYDQIYQSLLARGIRPLFVLLFAPSWAWDSTVSCNMTTQNCQYPPAATHFADAGRMAAVLATRYPKAAGIEVWNEPNLSHFWKPIADPVAYTQLLQTVYQSVKQVNPAMPVVLGGLNNLQNNTATDSDMSDFLGAVYALGGRNYMDAIAFHPYPLGADLTLASKSVDEVLTVRHAFGDDPRPLWATETGITTTDPSRPVSESAQAAGDLALYDMLRSVSAVHMVMINTLMNWGPDPYDPEFGYGIVNRDFTPKPAFCALAAARGSYSCASMTQPLL